MPLTTKLSLTPAVSSGVCYRHSAVTLYLHFVFCDYFSVTTVPVYPTFSTSAVVSVALLLMLSLEALEHSAWSSHHLHVELMGAAACHADERISFEQSSSQWASSDGAIPRSTRS